MNNDSVNSVELTAGEVVELKENTEKICRWLDTVAEMEKERKNFETGIKENSRKESIAEVVTLVIFGVFLLFRGVLRSEYEPLIRALRMIMMPVILIGGGYLGIRWRSRHKILGFFAMIALIVAALFLIVKIYSESSYARSVSDASFVLLAGFLISLIIWQYQKSLRMKEYAERGKLYYNRLKEEQEAWDAISKVVLVIIPKDYLGSKEKVRQFIYKAQAKATFGNRIVEYAVSPSKVMEELK
ncbi:MAG: hypothetical protein IJ600_01900 [Lachnospiraceae bacterium]|nr:hypothetical protein [Lachnospiraceae bacterium]